MANINQTLIIACYGRRTLTILLWILGYYLSMKVLESIKNNTGYTGVQFMDGFHSHGGIILSIDCGVMTIITHGSSDGTIDKLALVERLIDKYDQIYKIELVCCFSKQVFIVNSTLWYYIKYPSIQTQIRMDCTSDKIIFSAYEED